MKDNSAPLPRASQPAAKTDAGAGKITRRHLLLGAAACAASAFMPRFAAAETAALAAKSAAPAVGAAEAAMAAPLYFTAAEWAFVKAAAARIIPAEGRGPGAIEAHVPVFIDRQLLTAWGQGKDWYFQPPFDFNAPRYAGYQAKYTPAQIYRLAIAGIDKWAAAQYGAVFAALPAAKQDAVLRAAESDAIPLPELRSGDFFTLLLQNTKEGYFADPKYGGNYQMAAWAYIGFPGARAAFTEWAAKDNIPYPLGPVSIDGRRA